jgi:hypothetical protein
MPHTAQKSHKLQIVVSNAQHQSLTMRAPRCLLSLPLLQAQERLKQRRLAQLKLQQQRQAEAAAILEQESLQRLTRQVAGGKGKPEAREGYGLAGLV